MSRGSRGELWVPVNRTHDASFVLSYFQRLEIRPARTGDQFARQLEQRHGRETVQKLVNIMDNRTSTGQADDIYAAKNASLTLSLDFSAYSADLYRQFFDWFMARRQVTYGAILDVGCDNGIVTCFLALLYPEARVVGVDKSPDGIRCAVELAGRLQLSNVTFVCADLCTETERFQSERFNLILSLRSLHEIVGPFPEVRHWSLRDLSTKQVALDNPSLLRWIRDALEPDGEFLSCERLVSNAPFFQWIETLSQLGLNVEWSRSAWVRFHEVGQHQQMPALVLTASAPNEDRVDAIHRFYCMHEDGEVRDRRTFSDAVAEAVFFGIADKQFVGGVQLDYKDGSARLRSEVWRMARHVLLYQCTDRGYRLLTVFPSDGEPAIERQQSELLSQTPHLASSFRYDTPQSL